MKNKYLSFLILLSWLQSFCQQSNDVKISFVVAFKSIPIVLHDSTYLHEDGSGLKFETLKFYISNVQLLQNDVAVFIEQNSFHLIDISDASSQNIILKQNKQINFNKVRFKLGIDSITNVSGAMGGDLDPTKGMYWAWQSGYINFKMEGACSSCLLPKYDFEFHLGGYQYPFNALQQIELKTISKNNFNIVLDINQFFTAVGLSKQKQIMSPCDDAVKLSSQLANCFSVK